MSSPPPTYPNGICCSCFVRRRTKQPVAHHPSQTPLYRFARCHVCRFLLCCIAGQNALIKDKCNTRTSLMDVAKCLSGIIDGQSNAAKLSDSIHHLPPVRMAVSATASHSLVLSACEFSIGRWPRRFMEQEMAAALLHCKQGGEEINGPQSADALSHTFEYISEKLCDVIFVYQVREERDSKSFPYVVLLFSDGSHLCQCRALQTLGLGCRHFWAAMLLHPKFRFHVGLLHEHWLTEKARRTLEEGWPPAATPEWIAADRQGGAAGGTESVQEAASETGVGGGWKAVVGSSQTVQTVLLDLKGKGPSVQDRQILYADVSKTLGLSCSILSDTFPPEVAKVLADNFYAFICRQAQVHTGVRRSHWGGEGGNLRREPRYRSPAP